MSVDKEKIAKRISEIQVAISHVEKYSQTDVKEFLLDDERVAASKYYLLSMIEGCLSICTHIATKVLHKIPEGYATCFKLLSENHLIDVELGNRLGKMTGFRNLLIHQYWEIDDQKVLQYIKTGLKDIKKFIEIISDKYLKNPL